MQHRGVQPINRDVRNTIIGGRVGGVVVATVLDTRSHSMMIQRVFWEPASTVILCALVVGTAHADFTGSVTVDPFTAPVSIVPGGGESTFFETSLTGGLFNQARDTLYHPDIAPESPGYSTLSLETIPSAGRLVTHSSGAPTSAFAYQWHELTYRNADGSALDLSRLVSFSHNLAIAGSLHGTTFHLMVESESQGIASAWERSATAHGLSRLSGMSSRGNPSLPGMTFTR